MLGQSFQFKNGVSLKNRIVKSSMSEELAERVNRNPTAEYIELYRRWSSSGAGLLLSGNMMVDRRYTAEPRNVVIDEESDAALFKTLAQVAQQQGAQFWIQLNHPGRQIAKVFAWQPLAPSEIPMKKGLRWVYNKPKAMSETQIQEVITKFATSALLAKEWGFSGVQIHAAHGYLINQFLSPAENIRTDQWGGSLENRARFLLAVYAAVRAVVGADFPVAVKLNSADYMHGGFSEEDSMQVVKLLADAGVDLIEISGGTYESPAMVESNVALSTQKREAYFLQYAEQVRTLVDTPLLVTGGFRSTQGMQDALASKATDLIGLARPFAIDPEFGHKLLTRADYKITLPRRSTGSKTIDHLMLLNISWYEQQLALLGAQQNAAPNLHPWISVYRSLKSMGISAVLKGRR